MKTRPEPSRYHGSLSNIFVFSISLLFLLDPIASHIRDAVVKKEVERSVSQYLGLPVHIDKLQLLTAPSACKIDGLRVMNPVNFRVEALIHIPHVYALLGPAPTNKRPITIKELRLDIDNFSVLRDGSGNVNLNNIGLCYRLRHSKTFLKEYVAHPDYAQIESATCLFNQISCSDLGLNGEHTKVFHIASRRSWTQINNPDHLFLLILSSILSSLPDNIVSDYGMLDIREEALSILSK